MSNEVTAQHSTAINHIALSVFDLQKSTAFYKEVMQLEQISEPFKIGKHAWFRIGPHTQLHIIQAATRIEEHDINSHLAFSVKDLTDFSQHLHKFNVPYQNRSGDPKQTTARPDGIKQIFLQDPDNYWIEVNNDKF